MGIINPEEHYFLRVNGESMNKIVRNGAFALIHKQDYVDNGEIAVVMERGEIYNMIGGKIEDGEEAKETLAREAREEIGYELKNLQYLDSLGCYHYLDFLDKYELALMDFYSAEIDKKIAEPIEEDIELVWVKPEEVVDKMYFEYHRYFLKNYLEKDNEIEI